MIIEILTISTTQNLNGDCTHYKYEIPKNISLITYYVCRNSHGILARINIKYYDKNIGGLDNKSIDLECNTKMYIKVNNEKFIITNIDDMTNFYKYLSGTDINDFIKDFDLNIKEKEIESKKKKLDEDFI